MRWPVLVILALAALALQQGLAPLLALPAGWGGRAAPSFLLVLGVYVALWAPPMASLWAMLALGLLADLQHPMQTGGRDLGVVLGPSALGFLLAGYAVLQLRALLYRDSPLAIAAMVFIAGVFAHLTTVALLSFRGWPLGHPVPGWSAAAELLHRFVELLYTSVLAAALAPLLLRWHRMFGFEGYKTRR